MTETKAAVATVTNVANDNITVYKLLAGDIFLPIAMIAGLLANFYKSVATLSPISG